MIKTVMCSVKSILQVKKFMQTMYERHATLLSNAQKLDVVVQLVA